MKTSSNIKLLYFLGLIISISVGNILNGQILVIDAGHGYNSDGTNGDGRTATEINTSWDVSLKLRTLIQNNCTWTVHLTRPNNGAGSQVTINDRWLMANNWNADRILSIHCNAGGGTGTETFWCDLSPSTNSIDQAIATEVQARMVQYGVWNNRRVVEDNSYLAYHLGVLRYSNAAGCLNEIGFVDYSSDAVKLLDNTWRNSFANAYYVALQNHWGSNCSGTNPCNSITTIGGCGSGYSQSYTGGGSGSWFTSSNNPCNYQTPGNERIYSFVAPTTGTYSIQVASASGYVDYLWKSGSCSSSGWNCIDDINSTGTWGSMSWTAGTTYYLLLDDEDATTGTHTFYINCPTPPNPCNSITTIGGCGSGYSQSYTGGGSGSWFTSSNNPCNYQTPGIERIYSFVAPTTGTYSIQVTSASGYVDYLWKSGSCSSSGWNCIDDINSTGTWGSMSWTAGTTYYLLLDDEDATTGTHSFYINCPCVFPGSITISGGGTSCNNATLTASGGSGGTIYWQGTISNGTSTSTPSTSQTVTSTGTYYFRAYNSCGWGTQGSVSVTINSSPSSVTVSGGGSSCNSINLTTSGGSGGTIYWQGSTSGGTSTGTPSTSQIVTTSGTYYFRSYNSCGWGAQGNASVTINTVPSSVSISGGGAYCNSATLIASGGGGATIYWQGTTNGGTSTTMPSTSQTVTTSGTYYFRAYNSCGWGAQGSASVTINNVPASVSISGGGTFCNSATLTASGGSGGTIYWQGITSGGTSMTTPASSQTVTSSGTYYFRAYNSCGWGTQGSVSVTINNSPNSVSINGGGTFCNNAILMASGGSGGTIYWQGITSGGISTSMPSTSQTVTSSGTYYFRSNNSCGWGPEGSASVTINSGPGPILVTGGGTSCNSAILTASGGSGGTIYWQGPTRGGISFSNPSTSQIVNTSGTYYFRAYNGSCWGSEDSAVVTITTLPTTVSVSGGGTFCNSATITASGGNGGTVYWQGATSGGTSTTTPMTSQTVTSSGTYYFRSYNSCGWGSEGSTVVTINTIPTAVSVSGGGAFCNSAAIVASGGSGGTIYWQGTTIGGISTATPLTTQTVSSSGTYYFRAFNNCGWGTEGSATVTISSIPTAVSVSGSGTFCNSTVITASGGSGGTIYLQGTNSGGTSMATPLTSHTVSSSGTYYFRANNICGWGAEGSATVTINNSPGVVSVIGNGTFCNNATLTAMGGNGGTLYWQGATSGGTSLASVSSSQTVNSSGTYYFRSYNGNCWGPEGNATVNINTIPSAVTASGGGTYCSNAILTANGGLGGAIYWQGTTRGGISTTTPATSRNVSVSGTYYFRPYNNCGWGLEDSATVTINQSTSVPLIMASGPTIFCSGGSVTLTSGSSSGNSWQPNGEITQSIVVTNSGSFSVTYTDGNGCSATSTPITILVDPIAFASITSNGSTTFCQGGSVILSANTGSSYLWSTGAQSQSIVVSTPNNYFVTVTNSCGTSTSQATTVTVNPLPIPTINASGPTSFCLGNNVTLSTSMVGTSYLWSNNLTSHSILVSSPGNYSVSVSDVNGCTGTSSPIGISVNSLPTPTIIPNGSTTFCPGNNVILSPSITGINYLWSNNATTQSISASMAGTYAVTVTDPNGCTGTSPSISVGVNQLPTPTIIANGVTTFCFGNSVGLSSSITGINYLWSNSSTTQSILVTSTGNYSVAVTDGNGCTGTSLPTTVTVHALPAIPTFQVNGNNLACNTSTGVSYQWNLNGAPLMNDTLQFCTAIIAGYYSVTITDNLTGCSSTSTPTYILTTGIDNEFLSETIGVYPNPTDDIVNLVGNGLVNGNYIVLVSDVLGRILFQNNLIVYDNKIDEKISLNQFAMGTYIVTISNTTSRKDFKITKL